VFFDIGSLEFLTLIVLAILVFGPEKLPKMIQEAASFLRKVREFSDNAKRDIREELGPEFKDFELQDLNPRTFARKHLLGDDDQTLKELRELTTSLDPRKELTDVADAVNGRGTARADLTKRAGGGSRLEKNGTPGAAAAPAEAAPFDPDAT
jgi:sec-independent protein translocase protein TatB